MKKIVLIGVVVLALVAIAIVALMPTKKAAAVAVSTVAEKNVTVASAAADLPVGNFIASRDIVWQEVPESQAGTHAVVKSSRSEQELSGALVVKPIQKGAALQTGEFLSRDEPEFLAAVLEPGMRAFTIEVDSVTGGAGLLRPGNRVDVILASQTDPKKSRAVALKTFDVAQTLLTNLRVIAVDRTIEPRGFGVDPKAADAKRVASSSFNRKGTVTLEVTPKDVEVLTVARSNGQLSLSLRDAKAQTVETDGTSRSITQMKEILPQQVVSGSAPVAIKTFYGSSTEPPQQQ